MPIIDGKYVSPNWNDNAPPAITASELNAMSGTIADSQDIVRDVGDIIFTSRTDLGDRYLLCNGDIVTDSKYDKLKDILPYITPNNNIWKIVAGASGVYCASGNGWTVSVNQNNIYYTGGTTISVKTVPYTCIGVVFDGTKFSIAAMSGSLYVLYFTIPTDPVLVTTAQSTDINQPGDARYMYFGEKYIIYADKKVYYTPSVTQQFSSSTMPNVITGLCYTNKYYIASLYNATLYYSRDMSSWTRGIEYGSESVDGNNSTGIAKYAWYDGMYHIAIYHSLNVVKSKIMEFSNISYGSPFSYKYLDEKFSTSISGSEEDDIIVYPNVNSQLKYFLKSELKDIPTANTLTVHAVVLKIGGVSVQGTSIYGGFLSVCGTYSNAVLGSCPIGEKVLPIVDGGQSYPMIKGY